MLIVLYRWRIKPGLEMLFREGWREMTETIYSKRGSLGSRLHHSRDGTWVAYAQWPDQQTFDAAHAAGSANADAGAKMARAIEERFPEEHLVVEEDLLRREPFGNGATPV